MSQNYEIERRFLLADPTWRPEGIEPVLLDQGYFALGGKTGNGFLLVDDNGEGFFRLEDLDRNTLLAVPLAMDSLIELWHHAETLSPAHAILPTGWKARIRSHNNADFIFDIKGPRSGTTRVEIPPTKLEPAFGLSLLEKTGNTRLQKYRYEIPSGTHVWHLDNYLPPHDGGVTVEVELGHAHEALEIPAWVGEEITHRKVFAAPPAAPHISL